MADEIDTTGTGGAPEASETPITLNSAPLPAEQSANAVDEYANESEYERTQRLKLNTDVAPHSGAINQDIVEILKEVKLPERHEFKASGDAKTPPAVPAAKPAVEKSVAPEQPKKRDLVTALHTLKDDVQDVVRERKISLVRASALEQDKKRITTPIDPAPHPGVVARRRRTAAFLFASILLIVLGAGALYGVALVSQKRSEAPAQQYPSLLFAEQTETLPIDNLAPATLKETIAQARAQDTAPLGSITRIIPTISTTTPTGATATVPATTQQFFQALGVQAPDSLLRGLGSTFFFGIHTVDTEAPVFVIPVTDYDLAFAGMLAWETTMNEDLAPAFDAVPALTTDANGLPIARTFSDAVMLNYDVRVLKDDSGNIVMYYSFPTPSILVIAENPSTFSEVLTRLEAQGEL